MYDAQDILLVDKYNKPLSVYDDGDVQQGLYFSPLQWENLGRFSPSLLYSPIGDANTDVNEYDRQMLLRVSRKLYATMPEVAAASKQLANITIGLGSCPVFAGSDPKDSVWGESTEINLENNFYNACSPYGPAYDWRTIWKTVSYLVDRDGDVLLVPFLDRNGNFKLTFYETQRVSSRPGQLTIDYGKFKGLRIRDGVIVNDAGYPVGYQVLGITQDDDRTYSTNQAQLIYNPFSFSKFRGIPSITNAMRSAASLGEIVQALEMVIKIESNLFLQVKNEMGQAPRQRVKTLGQGIVNPTTKTAGFSIPAYEDTVGGIKYIRHKDEIKSFASQRPGTETMKFIEHLQKGVLLGTGIPLQWILNPESVSGAMARGIKVQITKAVQDRTQMLNKYACPMLSRAVAAGMANGSIPENFNTDKKTNQPSFSLWGLSQAEELLLDVGVEKQADINSYLVGLTSADEILQKYGKRYKNTVARREKDLRLLYDRVKAINQDYPEFASTTLQMMQNENMQMQPLPNESQQPQHKNLQAA